MILFGWPPIVVGLLIFITGVGLGRFLNRCVVRIPEKEGLLDSLKHIFAVEKPSGSIATAPHWTKLLPFFGSLQIEGRSPFSGRKVLGREPWLELLNGALLTTLYFFEVPVEADITQSCLHSSLSPSDIGTFWSDQNASLMLHIRYLFHAMLIEALFVATFIDFDLFIIPDGVTVPAMVIGFLGSVLFGELWLVPALIQDDTSMRMVEVLLPDNPLSARLDIQSWMDNNPRIHGLIASAVGFLVGGGVVWGVRLIGFWVLRVEAIGFGDVILMAMIGSFLGWQPTVIAFFIAPAAALIVVVLTLAIFRKREIPYGPYLSLGTVAVILGWNHLWIRTDYLFSTGFFAPVLFVLMGVLLFVALLGIQIIKRLIGIPLYYDDVVFEEWTSADHLLHFAGETIDHQQGQWRRGRWSGDDAGRGLQHEEQWRRPQPSVNSPLQYRTYDRQ